MLIFLATALQAATPTPPPPPPPHGGPQQMTCPVGGERFEAMVAGHYITWGGRPDGRQNSSWFMPLPIPVCPSNGLVVFRDFSDQEIQSLTTLIESDEYRAMVERDSTYYRAQWLATRIGRPEREALWLLLAASWQVKPVRGMTGQPMPSPVLARRYQEEFVRRVLALPRDPRDEDYRIMFARAANAQRELGRFHEAGAMLRELASWLEPKSDEEIGLFVDQLIAVAERRDSSIQPLDMVEEDEVAWLCMEPDLVQSDFNHRICSRPEIQAEIQEDRRSAEDAQRSEASEPAPKDPGQ